MKYYLGINGGDTCAHYEIATSTFTTSCAEAKANAAKPSEHITAAHGAPGARECRHGDEDCVLSMRHYMRGSCSPLERAPPFVVKVPYAAGTPLDNLVRACTCGAHCGVHAACMRALAVRMQCMRSIHVTCAHATRFSRWRTSTRRRTPTRSPSRSTRAPKQTGCVPVGVAAAHTSSWARWRRCASRRTRARASSPLASLRSRCSSLSAAASVPPLAPSPSRWSCAAPRPLSASRRSSTPSRPHLDPISTPSRPHLDPISIPSRPHLDRISIPAQLVLVPML